MRALPGVKMRHIASVLCFLAVAILAQGKPAAQTLSAQASPIAIVSIDSSDAEKAATVTGALEIAGGRAFIAAAGTITSGSQTTRVVLPHRGEMRVCAMSSIKLAADSSAPAGETPGLLMAMDHGAVEMSYASVANMKNADTLLTPDFRILIGGPGAADVKVRLGSQGDTCVDNSSVNGPYIVISSVFEGGTYRVQPGQRVMLQHGSLHEVVDQEKEPCGCPPSETKGNEFPVAQSMGLAPAPKASPAPPVSPEGQAQAQSVPPLVYQSAEHAPDASISTQSASTPGTVASAPSAKQPPAAEKKRGFFSAVGHFFRKIFGAEG
jgi:hypothetical protein